MEGILGRILIELAAIALQIGIVAFVQWLRSRAGAGTAGLEAIPVA